MRPVWVDDSRQGLKAQLPVLFIRPKPELKNINPNTKATKVVFQSSFWSVRKRFAPYINPAMPKRVRIVPKMFFSCIYFDFDNLVGYLTNQALLLLFKGR